MKLSVDEWLLFLKTTDTLIGVPLIVVGAVLMFFGWRMWKACVIAAYALMGAGVGVYFAAPGQSQLIFGVALGGIAALAAYYPVRQAAGLLGGLIGGALVVNVLQNAGLQGLPLWLAGGAAVFGLSAYSFINRPIVVIGVTAFLGAFFLLSGLVAFVMESRVLYGNLETLAAQTAIVVPFVLMVPAIMSCFYQLAEVRRFSIEF